jgi:hypothetical protein
MTRDRPENLKWFRVRNDWHRANEYPGIGDIKPAGRTYSAIKVRSGEFQATVSEEHVVILLGHFEELEHAQRACQYDHEAHEPSKIHA